MSKKGTSSLLRRDSDHSSGISDQTVSAIIGSASLIAILVLGLPWIGEYLRLNRVVAEMNTLHSQLDDVQSRKSKFSKIETVLDHELSEASSKSIGPDDVESIREQLVTIVRDSDASLRRLEVGENLVRPWGIDQDDPAKDASPGFGQASKFLLHKHTVQLQADGTLESMEKILSKAREKGWLMSTKSLTLTPNSVRESPVTLEVQWVLYGLEDAPPEEFDEMFEGEDFAARTTDKTLR